MRIAIMQPYLFPYIGYFQLISSADLFVVYDNIQYTKKGWINRNRILVNGRDAYITAALQQDSDFLDIRDRRLSPQFDRTALLNRLRGAYLRAPYFEPTMRLVTDAVNNPDNNLFEYLIASLHATCEHIGLDTPMIRSSAIDADHSLRGQDRVLDICRALGADSYVNAAGGRALYSHDEFAASGVALSFIESAPFQYQQGGGEFVPWLSIIDVLMFTSPERVHDVVTNGYQLA